LSGQRRRKFNVHFRDWLVLPAEPEIGYFGGRDVLQ